ncbi:MAG: MarR family transcriptional regulator [Fulvivirga sp.]|uniref:MarR family winged helix-turn-helix transcriptional regulator n=1 Tax=Fulvivirga sp. TaxID=1931237 RepID=UPI0032EFF8D0
MSSSNPNAQIGSIDNKLAATLHKIGEVYKYLLLQKGKQFGLSPIQVQILLFVAYHENASYRTVSYLSQELNITKPTVSDAVKVLHQKGYIDKSINEDTRSYSIVLKDKGRKILPDLESFDQTVVTSIKSIDKEIKPELLENLLMALSRLQEHGAVNTQRMCFNCKFLQNDAGKFYCKLLNKNLTKPDLRVDCPEFDLKE